MKEIVVKVNLRHNTVSQIRLQMAQFLSQLKGNVQVKNFSLQMEYEDEFSPEIPKGSQ